MPSSSKKSTTTTAKPKRATTKKKTPAKKAENQVFDVSRPGSGKAASATARPVISTKGPVIQDPMVVASPKSDATESDDNQSTDRQTAPPVNRSAKRVIQPLHNIEEDTPPEEQASENVDKSDDSPITAPPVPEGDEKTDTPAKSPDSPKEPAKPKPAPEPEKPKVEDKPVDPVAAKPSENPNLKTDDLVPKISTTPLDAKLDPRASDPTARLIAEHAERITKLVESEQYFLPIYTAEARHRKRLIVVGLLLSVILGLAWYNVALDAGLLTNTFNLPHTSFFSVSS